MSLGERIGKFLCRDDDERQWMLDMHVRLVPISRASGVAVLIMWFAIVPWTNPLAIIPTVVAGVVFGVATELTSRRRDPRPIMGAIVLMQAMIAVSIVINDRAHVGDLFLLTVAIVPCSGSFPGRVVVAGAVWSALLMVAAAFALDPGAVLASPPTLILPLFTLVAMTMLATAVRSASIDHRRAAVVDGLTGALNRTSLAARSDELAHSTSLTGEPVAVVVADIDHFKLVNDRHGHPGGDRVLVALVALLHEQVGVRGQVYRLGGEEFAIVLPGLRAADAVLLAEDIARTTRATPLSDVAVTISMGVAASAQGSTFAFDEVFAAADEALYAAKRGGRDAVRIAQLRAAAA